MTTVLPARPVRDATTAPAKPLPKPSATTQMPATMRMAIFLPVPFFFFLGGWTGALV